MLRRSDGSASELWYQSCRAFATGSTGGTSANRPQSILKAGQGREIQLLVLCQGESACRAVRAADKMRLAAARPVRTWGSISDSTRTKYSVLSSGYEGSISR